MSSHFDEGALLRYCLSLLAHEDAVKVRRHLAGCPSCAAYANAIGAPIDSGDAAEDDGSRSAAEGLLSHHPDEWPKLHSSRRERLATVGAVQAFIEVCDAELDKNRDGRRAEALSSILVESADALPATFAAKPLQALAWTRRATALLRVGRLPEAMTAVREAQERANGIPSADYERALIAFTAADILRELGRTDEALLYIRDAATTFARHGDMRRHASVREMEAAVLYRRGEYEAATEIFMALYDAATDPLVRGRLSANIAHCLIAVNDHARALPFFVEAERVFREAGNDGYVTRIAWGKARVLRATGDDEQAIIALRDVFQRFGSDGASAEWVRAGIELVEWLLPTSAYKDVRDICLEVYERAIQAGMQLQALEALTYLREASMQETLTADRAKYVRRFIEDLPSSPQAEFLPPA